jgi:hypothetical protein
MVQGRNRLHWSRARRGGFGIGWFAHSSSTHSERLSAAAGTPTPSPASTTLKPTVTPTQALAPTLTRAPVVSVPAPVATAALAVPPAARPVGVLAIASWHDTAFNGTCVTVEVNHQNRSDTAINQMTQVFQTFYTPMHAEGEYPPQVNGPLVTASGSAGVAAFASRQLNWQVCAPELTSLRGPDANDQDIGAQPQTTSWTWFGESSATGSD